MRRDGRELLAIFAGGFVGTVLRADLAEAWSHDPGAWPWATFLVNIAGTALLGYLATSPHARRVSAYRRPLLCTGLCGGLTTFSALQLELLWMLDADRYGLAASYAAASIVLGLLSVTATVALARRTRVPA
jgi:CrcB protein